MGLNKKTVSKRITLKDRYKIQKKVNEHNRKQRRQSKKDQKSGATQRRALRKDPGIPNLWPFKEQLLRQMEAKKDRDEERRLEIQNRRKLDLTTVAERAEEFAEKEAQALAAEEDGHKHVAPRHAGSVLKSVIEEADVVLQVLDCRDPIGTRSQQIEEMILQKDKRMVLVLNKSDLIPEAALLEWIAHLKRAKIPNCVGVLPFAANVQKQRNFLKRVPGAELLIKHLKMLNRGLKTIMVVGVVGVPNVGKSSVVNSLKLSKAVISSAQAGSTKQNQRVLIDSKLELIDTPGVTLKSEVGSGSAQINALRVCLDPVVEDSLKAVEDLVKSAPEKFMVHYALSKFDTPEQFLIQIAERYGKKTKGGALHLKRAADVVLNELQKGKLKFFISAPTAEDVAMAQNDDDEEEPLVLGAFAKEFDFADEDDAMAF
ncbi:hypothetical protein BASA81_002696 [Batrachochytrium salamandrivorans]|nr:hypothetical protein BASA81_002696 [Batrachochytrium salamandrivorans]